MESIVDTIRDSIRESISITTPETDVTASSAYANEPAVQPNREQSSGKVIEIIKPLSTPAVVSPEVPLSPPVSGDMKTVAMWNAPNGTEPVVGWLVCVKGIYFGQSFSLKTGNNSVGRSMEMDVPLAQVSTISRIRHCIITYEPEKKEFFVQPGESSGLTYLNGNLVLSFTRINARDTIKLGSCEFVFYPLCGERFDWKNYIN